MDPARVPSFVRDDTDKLMFFLNFENPFQINFIGNLVYGRDGCDGFVIVNMSNFRAVHRYRYYLVIFKNLKKQFFFRLV